MVKLSHKLIAFQVWRLSTGSIPVVEVTSRVMSPLTSCHVRIFRKFGSLPKCQQTKSRPMGARGARSPNSVGRRGDGCSSLSSSAPQVPYSRAINPPKKLPTTTRSPPRSGRGTPSCAGSEVQAEVIVSLSPTLLPPLPLTSPQLNASSTRPSPRTPPSA